jgi:hypothetical protein
MSDIQFIALMAVLVGGVAGMLAAHYNLIREVKKIRALAAALAEKQGIKVVD